jgi:hypothetical protein
LEYPLTLIIKRRVFNGCKDSLFISFVQEKTKLLAFAVTGNAGSHEILPPFP